MVFNQMAVGIFSAIAASFNPEFKRDALDARFLLNTLPS